MTNAPPSYNPANGGHLGGLFREMFKKFLQKTDDMMPAEVIVFDRARNVVQVQPLILVVTTNDEKVVRAPVAEIPVFQIGAGGFVLNFNLKKGDIGYIKANDRDTSLFMQSFGQAEPNTDRLHSFEDGVFFPAVLRGFTINDEDEENCVLQTLDGSQRVAIWPDRIKITSATNIILDSPLVTITGELVADGSRVAGNATFNGTIHTTVDVFAQTISLHNHVHSGVQTGGGTTAGPVP